jgi:hypothetical protein
MQQLAMQLFMLPQQNNPSISKKSGIIANLSKYFLKTQWILDSSATDHIMENKELLQNRVPINM